MRAALAAWWAELCLARRIRVIELEVRFHEQQLAFYAERRARLGVALVNAREAMKLLRLRAHQPSLSLVSGARR